MLNKRPGALPILATRTDAVVTLKETVRSVVNTYVKRINRTISFYRTCAARFSHERMCNSEWKLLSLDAHSFTARGRRAKRSASNTRCLATIYLWASAAFIWARIDRDATAFIRTSNRATASVQHRCSSLTNINALLLISKRCRLTCLKRSHRLFV